MTIDSLKDQISRFEAKLKNCPPENVQDRQRYALYIKQAQADLAILEAAAKPPVSAKTP